MNMSLDSKKSPMSSNNSIGPYIVIDTEHRTDSGGA